MMSFQPPLDAYREDMASVADRTTLSGGTESDAVWVLVAAAIDHLAWLPAEERGTYAERFARSLSELKLSGADPDACEARDIVLRATLELAAPGGEGGGEDGFAAAVQLVARREEEAGALHLACSTLSHLLRAFPGLSPRAVGLVRAQLGRIARQMGDLDEARELYTSALKIGRRARDAEVQAWALMGLAALAMIRGNYPESRHFYRSALRVSDRAGLCTISCGAHHGLLLAAVAARDVDTALAHGWAAYRGTQNDPMRQAELLANLAEVCAIAGYHGAALRANLTALGLTDLVRICIPAVGGAGLAAARVGDIALLNRLARRANSLLDETQHPFERARTATDLAEAFGLAGESDRSREYALRARSIARAGGFFEVLHRLQELPKRIESTPKERPAALTPSSREVISAIGELAVPSAAGV